MTELDRYISTCRAISENGKYQWWARLADLLEGLRIAELEAELQAVLDGTAHEADLAKIEELRAEMRGRATIAGGKIASLEARLAAAEADAERLAEALRELVETVDFMVEGGEYEPTASTCQPARTAIVAHEARKGDA